MILDTPELGMLLANHDDHSVSVYMPTYPAGRDTEQGPIRFRNLIGQAEKQLLAFGADESQMQRMLEPAHRLSGNRDFWGHQSLGLAMFLSPTVFKYYRLPVAFDETVIINSRFSLKQLLKLLAGESRYYILWLNKGGVQLFECSRYGLRELTTSGLPEDIGAALEPIGARHVGQHAPNARHSGGDSPRGLFHGHGSVLDTDKSDIQKYFRRAAGGVHQLLRHQNSPLLLCGVEYLHALYRSANTYPFLADQGIMINPNNHDELHRLSQEILQDMFDHEREKAIDLYHRNRGTGLASSNVAEIVPAVDDGRVRYLFVEVNARHWGRYDSRSHEVVIHSGRARGDEDLLDFASIMTILKDGTVYALEPDGMPNGSMVSAVYRY